MPDYLRADLIVYIGQLKGRVEVMRSLGEDGSAEMTAIENIIADLEDVLAGKTEWRM